MEDSSKYDKYVYEQDNLVNGGHSGKHRSKKETEQNTNRHDTCGHTRKIETKFHNTETKRKGSK